MTSIVFDQGAPGPDAWKTSDDYPVAGEVLADVIGEDTVKTLNFDPPVVSFWAGVIGDNGIVRIDHYGGDPSETAGIPVYAGEKFPIPDPASSIKAYIPAGLRLVLWGHRRG